VRRCASESDVTVTTSVNIRERIQITIDSISKFLRGNEAIRQQAHDWHTTFCDEHHVLKFRDLAKVQQINPQNALQEAECYTCSLCEIERNRERLSKRQLMSDDPHFVRGSVFVSVKQIEREQQQIAIRQIAMERIPTLPRHTEEIPMPVLATLPQANIITAPLPARGIVYANTPQDDGDATEHRLPAIKLSRSTLQIPAVKAEVAILELMRGQTSPHDTGEQVPVVLLSEVEDGAFLL